MKQSRGSMLLIALGFLSVMLLLAFNLHSRFSRQARLTVVADQGTTARYFLESYVADVLWQIRKQKNLEGSALFEAFRNGISQSKCPVDYKPSSLITDLALELQIDIGPMSASFDQLKLLTFNANAFRSDSTNEEKRGSLVIKCEVTYQGRDYSLETRVPFKVVMTTTPILRKFVMFFDQLHLEQVECYGIRDKINVIPIRTNYSPANISPISLWGWDFSKPEMNGSVFLGRDDKEIRLNLVGGKFKDHPAGDRANLEDLWQISPSAFSVTSGLTEFDQEALLNDSQGNPLVLRGASIPMVYSGHFARMGLLGFSEEILDPDFLGNFKIENFLNGDSSFTNLRQNEPSMKQSSALRLHGNRVLEDFDGFPREIYGKVFSRFFLLSFFEAPSIGVPIAFNPDPSHTITVAQYGGAQNVPFKPVSGTYSNYMSRVVSGGEEDSTLGNEANVPVYRDLNFNHKLISGSDFKSADGLEPAGAFAGIARSWFPSGRSSNVRRPEIVPGSILERVSRFFKNESDFKKVVGLMDKRGKKFWIDGVVYINGPLDLSEGIASDNIRGGIVLVNGPIKLGNVTREIGADFTKSAIKEIKAIPLSKMLTFVSLSGEKITLTGRRYYGVQLLSFKDNLGCPVDQLSFVDGAEMIFIGGLGCSTPKLEAISRQLKNDGIFPYFNFLPAMGAEACSYTVSIDERIDEYEFLVR